MLTQLGPVCVVIFILSVYVYRNKKYESITTSTTTESTITKKLVTEKNYYKKYLENRKTIRRSNKLNKYTPSLTDRVTTNSKLNCDYETCVQGQWKNCDEKMTNFMSMKYDVYRKKKKLPQLEKMLALRSKCGYMQKPITEKPTWWFCKNVIENHIKSHKKTFFDPKLS